MHTFIVRNETPVHWTFERQANGFVITKWVGATWLVRQTADAQQTLRTWRRLRRAGYRPTPRDEGAQMYYQLFATVINPTTEQLKAAEWVADIVGSQREAKTHAQVLLAEQGHQAIVIYGGQGVRRIVATVTAAK
jgi:hypothetical protein